MNTTQTNKATARPWTNDPLQPTIWANDGETQVAKISDLPWINGKSDWITEQANAALIVRAVNEHDALCAVADAAKTALDELSDGRGLSQFNGAHLQSALSTLAAIRKEAA